MNQKRRRRWLQFSLRTVLLLFVVAALALGRVRVLIESTRQQNMVLKRLAKFQPLAAWNDAPWWREKYVRDLSFSRSKLKPRDDDLVHLKELRQLEMLDLSGADVTDRGLTHLTGLGTLTHLELEGTDVTDAGLVHLQCMSHLEYLGLMHTKVTRNGVSKLMQSLPNTTIPWGGVGSE